jgi:hypothetical protein
MLYNENASLIFFVIAVKKYFHVSFTVRMKVIDKTFKINCIDHFEIKTAQCCAASLASPH